MTESPAKGPGDGDYHRLSSLALKKCSLFNHKGELLGQYLRQMILVAIFCSEDQFSQCSLMVRKVDQRSHRTLLVAPRATCHGGAGAMEAALADL